MAIGLYGYSSLALDSKGRIAMPAKYKEALKELEFQVPNMHIQVTTEAIGKYSPDDMRKLAYDVTPPGTSIGTSELIPSRKPTIEDIKLYKYLLFLIFYLYLS